MTSRPATMAEVVVTVTPTIVDGAVVRWYAAPQHDGGQHRELCSASRNGVRVHHQVDGWQDVIAAAGDVHEQLQRDRHADLSHLATHRRRVHAGRPATFIPIERGSDGA